MAKAKKDIKKVVLAYSGGLDTSIIIPWLKENYNNCEVIAVSADVGQGTELDGLEEKALKTGASKLYIEDLKEEFIHEYVYQTEQEGEDYENKYMLARSSQSASLKLPRPRAQTPSATAAPARATIRFVSS